MKLMLLIPLSAPAAILAVPTPPVIPRTEAVVSFNYILSAPRIRAMGDTYRVDGEVCRRANRSGLSPAQIRIEHLDASGQLVETVSAFLPPLSWREDQRCGHYSAALKQLAQPGDIVRACIGRKTCKSNN